jgi:broad specificity phosphatase PhoE
MGASMNSPAERFYFVRHGQTDANIGNLAAGAGWDIDLNETGISQARELAGSEHIKSCLEVQTICVSPMRRAMQTANALRSIIKAPLVQIDELREWHLGDWERRSWSDLPSLFHPESNPPNGESQLEFGQLVAVGLNKALAHPGPVLIVAHGGVWHGIARILSLPGGSISNCELKQLSRASANHGWTLE